jgi:hypothetical protein
LVATIPTVGQSRKSGEHAHEQSLDRHFSELTFDNRRHAQRLRTLCFANPR